MAACVNSSHAAAVAWARGERPLRVTISVILHVILNSIHATCQTEKIAILPPSPANGKGMSIPLHRTGISGKEFYTKNKGGVKKVRSATYNLFLVGKSNINVTLPHRPIQRLAKKV